MRPHRVVSRSYVGWVVFAAAALAIGANAQSAPLNDTDDGPVAALLMEPALPVIAVLPAATAAPPNANRILGVIPDFQTVREPDAKVAPLTPKQKWALAWQETVDPFNIASAAMAAGFSQTGNQTPKYGDGGQAYGKRFGAALADFGTQNFFSAGLLASVLHQDPRYYRKGPGTGVLKRVAYSVSRIAITRQDSGATAFNTSSVLGTAMGIAASNLYYPTASVRGSVMLGRLNTSFTGGIMGNLMSEFWPDLQKKLFHRHKAVAD